ncbi:MAG: aminotransferase class V-fold PLP-dependent enzyme [Terriglobia bacterium]
MGASPEVRKQSGSRGEIRRPKALGHRSSPPGKKSNGQIKAIVLAAGEGRSLYPLTKDRPKAMLSIGGQPLLERLAKQLRGCGVTEMVVIAGYEQAKVLSALQRIQRSAGMKFSVIHNTRYSLTNTLYSLSLARNAAAGHSALIIDGDLIVEDEVIARMVAAPEDAVLAIDSRRVMGQEEVKVDLDKNQRVVALGKDVVGTAESVGLSKFSAPVADGLFQVCAQILDEGCETEYYETAISRLLKEGQEIGTIDMEGCKWTEIDFLTDFEEALRVFGSRAEMRAFRDSRRSQRQYLFCPGPVLVSAKVKEAMASAEIGHREVEFSELLNRVRLKLGQVYGVKNFHEYSTVVITGSGSAANEAVLGSAGQGRRLLILSNGGFGERWLELAEFLELKFTALQLRWGQPLPLDRVEELIKSKEVDAVGMVHHETSTGMLNPLARIGALARQYGKELYVDAVSSIGAEPIDLEASGVTFCTGSANKAIASVPGLSFVCGKRSAFDRLKTVRPRSLYLDLYRHFLYNDRHYQTPNTPAVNLYFALEAALDGILDGGLVRTFEKYRSLAAQIRTGLKELGFRFFIPEEHMSSVLTTVELPAGFGADEFHERLKRLGYITYTGKGILRDRAFQVANIGELRHSHVRSFLQAVSRVLK